MRFLVYLLVVYFLVYFQKQAHGCVMVKKAEAIAHEAAVEAAPVREPSVRLDADADGDDALANLWLTITGAVPYSSDASGDDDDKAQQGYDKSPRQRKAD